MSTKSPYGLGHFGHARCCKCDRCLNARVAEVRGLWAQNGKFAELDPERTIFVRSHFRSGRQDERVRQVMAASIRKWRREGSRS